MVYLGLETIDLIEMYLGSGCLGSFTSILRFPVRQLTSLPPTRSLSFIQSPTITAPMSRRLVRMVKSWTISGTSHTRTVY